VILSVGGQAVKDVPGLLGAVAALRPGEATDIELERRDGRQTLKVTPSRRNAPRRQQ